MSTVFLLLISLGTVSYAGVSFNGRQTALVGTVIQVPNRRDTDTPRFADLKSQTTLIINHIPELLEYVNNATGGTVVPLPYVDLGQAAGVARTVYGDDKTFRAEVLSRMRSVAIWGDRRTLRQASDFLRRLDHAAQASVGPFKAAPVHLDELTIFWEVTRAIDQRAGRRVTDDPLRFPVTPLGGKRNQGNREEREEKKAWGDAGGHSE
jgi:hypothetical protein